jgi:hypothetical protein
MMRSRVRLAVCAALFVAWIGYLVYLAVTTTRPVILSRPQFLAADLYVIVTVEQGKHGNAPAAAAKIRQVIWSRYPDDLREMTLPVATERTHLIAQALAAKGFALPGAASPVIPQAMVPLGVAAIDPFSLPLANLPECGSEQGWKEPGEYILPLTRTGAGRAAVYQVTPIPRSPGYVPPLTNPRTFEVPARIYLATPVARRELADLKAEFHP